MMGGIVRETKLLQVSVPFAMITIKKSYDHNFEHPIHPFDGISLRVIGGTIVKIMPRSSANDCNVLLTNSVLLMSKNYDVSQRKTTRFFRASYINFPFTALKILHPLDKQILDYKNAKFDLLSEKGSTSVTTTVHGALWPISSPGLAFVR